MSSFVPSLVYPGRYFPHRTLPELVNYLLQSPGWRILMRDETNAEILREVLFTTFFERMSLMGHIVATVYEIKLKEGHNQGTTAIFYLWLKDDFLSFLTRVEGIIPDIFALVDVFLQKEGLRTLQKILECLMFHFSEVPLCITRSILLGNMMRSFPHLRRFREMRFLISPPPPSVGAAMAIWQRQRNYLSPHQFSQKNGMTEDDALILFAKLKNFGLIQGRLFHGRLLSLAISKFLIKRLSHIENPRDMFSILMRVLSGCSFA
jgi:hypothetical protein